MRQQWERPPKPWRKAIWRAFVAALIVAVGSLFLKDQFKSEASILPDQSRSRNMGSLGDLSKAAGLSGLLGGAAEGGDLSSLPDILLSRWICEQLLKKDYSFHTRSWRFGGWTAKHQTLFDYLGEDDMDRAMSALLRHYTADKLQRTNLVAVSVETASPELSQQVLEESLRLLEDFLDHQVQTRGDIKVAFAKKRLIEAREEYQQAESDLKQFAEKNRGYPLSSDPGVRLAGQRLEGLLKIRGDLVALTVMNHEAALMEAADDTTRPNVLDRANLPIRKSRPARSLLVLLAAFLVGSASLLWDHRVRLSAFLRDHEA